MPDLPALPSKLSSYALIAAVVAVGVGVFLYTAGALSPSRLTPDKMVAAFAPAGGAGLGHRRNHAKGICFTGTFEPSADASSVSRAAVFAPGTYPVVGRFNLGTADPNAADATVRVRGLGLQISARDQIWRMAMINAPVFAVSTPQAFYELLSAKSDAAKKAFAATHSEFAKFAAWARSGS